MTQSTSQSKDQCNSSDYNCEAISALSLRAMLVYAVQCDREAARLDNILSARDRRYDRLGPVLNLIRDVQSSIGKPNDAAVARLLADAYLIAGSPKQFSPDAIRKLREYHLAP